MTRFERWHFRPAYTVQPEPEFPGGGDWRCPLHRFDGEGRVVAEPGPRRRAPLFAKVGTDDGEWVGEFVSDDMGIPTRVISACPSPQHLCVVVGGLAYLVDVRRPAEGAATFRDVHQVIGMAEPALLLLVTWREVSAISEAGAAWRSGRLVSDELRVEHAAADGIVCSGYDVPVPHGLMLDPRTGRPIRGRDPA